MKLRRLLAIARKEVIQIRRDSRSLMIVLLMPLMLMTVMGYGINLDTKHIPVCALRSRRQPAESGSAQAFQSSQYFDLVATVERLPRAGRAIDDGTLHGSAIVIPQDFSARLNDGRHG